MGLGWVTCRASRALRRFGVAAIAVSLGCSAPAPDASDPAAGGSAAGGSAAGGSAAGEWAGSGGATSLTQGGTQVGDAGGGQGCSVPIPTAGLKLDGDLFISDEASLKRAQQYGEVTGTVRVTTSFAGVVDLPALTAVGGDLAAESAIITSPSATIVESNVTRLRAPNLQTIGGRLWVYLNFKLVELDLRSLTSAGTVFIDRNPTLRMVRFDAYPTDLSFDAPLADCLVPAFPNVLVVQPRGNASCSCTTECGRLVAHCE